MPICLPGSTSLSIPAMSSTIFNVHGPGSIGYITDGSEDKRRQGFFFSSRCEVMTELIHTLSLAESRTRTIAPFGMGDAKSKCLNSLMVAASILVGLELSIHKAAHRGYRDGAQPV